MEGAYDARYRVVAVDGEVAIATGTSTYFVEPGGPIDRVYDNCFVMRFGADGRCRQFADYYSLRETELLVLELRVVDLTEGEIAERSVSPKRRCLGSSRRIPSKPPGLRSS